MPERAPVTNYRPPTTDITQRDVFWDIPEDFKGILAYNPRFDIQDALNLRNLEGQVPPEEFARRQIQFVGRTRRQIERAISERFHTEYSITDFYIEAGKLKTPDYDEPQLERDKKGQQFLKDNGSIETDREQAEVNGLEDAEKILADTTLAENSSVVIISAQGKKGSLYTQNFLRIYAVQDNGQGRLYQYNVENKLGELLEIAQSLDSGFPMPQDRQQLDPEYFLKTPIASSLTPKEIAALVRTKKGATKYQTYSKIVKENEGLISQYIGDLLKNPEVDQIKKGINAIFTSCDITYSRLHDNPLSREIRQFAQVDARVFSLPIAAQVNYLGMLPVRRVNVGCPGAQKGFIIQPTSLRNLASGINPRGVGDFARFWQSEDEDTSDFPCPRCRTIITYGAGIKECPGCGLEATCA